jgi:hypothetical protein
LGVRDVMSSSAFSLRERAAQRQARPGSERRSWFDDARVTALRAAGKDVRQCTGPLREAGRACPLVTSGHCRLAEEAELIVSLLPDGDPDCAAVLAAHRRLAAPPFRRRPCRPIPLPLRLGNCGVRASRFGMLTESNSIRILVYRE